MAILNGDKTFVNKKMQKKCKVTIIDSPCNLEQLPHEAGAANKN
jgi:hypothetical protein